MRCRLGRGGLRVTANPKGESMREDACGGDAGFEFWSCWPRVAACLVGLTATFAFALSSQAAAGISNTEILPDGSQRTTYRVGPLDVTTGQNRISYKPIFGSERPSVNGWITRIVPNLVNEDGSIPKSSRVMFHHGVWINQSAPRGSQLFFATGEEKTEVDLPDGYGLRYRTSDVWVLNHMIHNLVPDPMTLYVTYTIDFIPDTSTLAADITPVEPIWMDVQSGVYPVFDVYRDSGGSDGRFTYPQDAENPYPGGGKKNEKVITTDGVLVGTTGHVHTGGLSTNLFLKRDGASYAGPECDPPKDFSRPLRALESRRKSLAGRLNESRRKNGRANPTLERQYVAVVKQLNATRTLAARSRSASRRCRSSQPNVQGNRVHLFNSKARYFHNTGPVS